MRVYPTYTGSSPTYLLPLFSAVRHAVNLETVFVTDVVWLRLSVNAKLAADKLFSSAEEWLRALSEKDSDNDNLAILRILELPGASDTFHPWLWTQNHNEQRRFREQLEARMRTVTPRTKA